ncbi:MAG TPA: D-2-hydroxyacid dehydrogenase [Gaiellaceae bacterium]|nr:D-2-hydroxyacid dehydrogenase [Gaiellaceae bacterium]
MTRVVIATPIEPELVARLRAVDERLEIVFEPELLPPPRWPSDHVGDPSFERTQAQQERFEELLAEAEIVLGYPREDPALIPWLVRSAPRLRWVQATYAGAGQQLAAAGLSEDDVERIIWTSSVGIHATPLGEWALFGILALTKGLPLLEADKRERRWSHYPVDEVRGTTALIAGLGEIGREVARLADAFGMNVLSVRRNDGDLDELLPQADSVVITLPLTGETRGLFHRARIERMKPGAILVNVGRGAVVDETALIDALRSGHLRGAALDVYATEPLPADSALWELDNVILSPHTAAQSIHENARVIELFADNLRRFLAGEELRSRIRTDLFY